MPVVTRPDHRPRLTSTAAARGDQHDEAAAVESLLSSAVREGATRGAVAAGLGALVAIHAVDAVGKWTETRYMFWLYVAVMVAAVVVAGWVLFTRSRLALLAAAAVAGSVLLGYVVDRTVGLPNATGDIGNWLEPLGLTSVVVEAVTVLAAIGAFALAGARGSGR